MLWDRVLQMNGGHRRPLAQPQVAWTATAAMPSTVKAEALHRFTEHSVPRWANRRPKRYGTSDVAFPQARWAIIPGSSRTRLFKQGRKPGAPLR